MLFSIHGGFWRATLRSLGGAQFCIMAISIFGFEVAAGNLAAVAAPIVDNNGDPGFALFPSSADWTFSSNPPVPGYLTTIHHNGAPGGSGAKQATWTFTGLAPGNYQVAVTWTSNANRASNAPYTILDNTTSVYSTTVNQQNAPAANSVESGINFQNLGGPVTITSGTLVVRLTDNANGYVIADAVRIECVP